MNNMSDWHLFEDTTAVVQHCITSKCAKIQWVCCGCCTSDRKIYLCSWWWLLKSTTVQREERTDLSHLSDLSLYLTQIKMLFTTPHTAPESEQSVNAWQKIHKMLYSLSFGSQTIIIRPKEEEEEEEVAFSVPHSCNNFIVPVKIWTVIVQQPVPSLSWGISVGTFVTYSKIQHSSWITVTEQINVCVCVHGVAITLLSAEQVKETASVLRLLLNPADLKLWCDQTCWSVAGKNCYTLTLWRWCVCQGEYAIIYSVASI